MHKKEENGKKKTIYYARTYRHLKVSALATVAYILCLVIPSVVIFVANIESITKFMSELAVTVFGVVAPGISLYIREDAFSILATIKFVEFPTVYPSMVTSLMNFVVALAIVIFCNTGRRMGKPVPIYITIMAMIHTINSVYFIFATNYFPYTVFDYSNLYMKQQIGIWLAFIIMMGMVTALQGKVGLFYRITSYVLVMAYSLVFGIVRYVAFLYILEQFSIIYMALMFFVLGPFFDFLYLVWIYGIFMDKVIALQDSEKGRGDWQWS